MFGADMSDNELRDNITLHQEHMYNLIDDGAAAVYPEALIDGDFSSLEAAFLHCGLEYQQKIATDFVDAKLWHFRS